MKRDLFIKQLFTCFGYLLIGMIMCLMLSVFSAHFMGYFLVAIAFQACTTAIVALLLCNFAWKDGKKEIRLVNTYKYKKVSFLRWLALGFLTVIPLYALEIMLILSKLGRIFEFGVAYKFLASPFIPIVTWLAKPQGQYLSASDYSWTLIAAIAVIQLLIPVAMAVTHQISYNDKINSDTIVYGDLDKE